MREKPDAFHAHEALHTAYVLQDTFAEHVAGHPSVRDDADLSAKAQAAIDAMMSVYQALGSKIDAGSDGTAQ